MVFAGGAGIQSKSTCGVIRFGVMVIFLNRLAVSQVKWSNSTLRGNSVSIGKEKTMNTSKWKRQNV